MKKQLNPTIKAHLIRSAFYLLLLLGVCAIPFALAQPKRLPGKAWLSHGRIGLQLQSRRIQIRTSDSGESGLPRCIAEKGGRYEKRQKSR